MNKKITLSLISLSLIALSTFAESRKIENLNFGWRFSYGDFDNASSSSFNDSSWQSVNLPHDFSISQNFTSSYEAESVFLPGGTGWYRKKFALPDTLE